MSDNLTTPAEIDYEAVVAALREDHNRTASHAKRAGWQLAGNFPPATIGQVRQNNRGSGQYFFDPDNMRDLRSRAHDTVYQGGVFVMSEAGPFGRDGADIRAYSVLLSDPWGRVSVVHTRPDAPPSESRQFFRKSSHAHMAARRIADAIVKSGHLGKFGERGD